MKLIPFIFAAALTAAFSCTSFPEDAERTGMQPDIFPDYAGVTVPVNIAPLNFRLETACEKAVARLSSGSGSFTVAGPEFDIPIKDWRMLTRAGGSICVELASRVDGSWQVWEPFTIAVSPDTIDPYLTYRLIEPGYEAWNEMGIYQRCLEDFSQTAVVENKRTGYNCLNCHSFPAQDAGRLVFHMRGPNGGTYIADGTEVEKLDPGTSGAVTALVYPQWNAAGDLIAFSVNDTYQVFHSTNPNRVEVYDSGSDVVVYDVAAHELHSCPALMGKDVLETYPTFSPDGGKLYFCSSPRQDVPEHYEHIRYSICSIDFDAASRSFGESVDTLFNNGRSTVFPRVSPDGRFLMFTETEYGCFPIWHKDAQLRLLDLQSGRLTDVDALNSDDVESYHSWSGNGRWVVFSSRRLDGLYTRPFIAFIDVNGRASKPFLLPQKDTHFYHDFFMSYNIPELTSDRVSIAQEDIVRCALDSKETKITYR